MVATAGCVSAGKWSSGKLGAVPPVPPMGINSYDAVDGAYTFEQVRFSRQVFAFAGL